MSVVLSGRELGWRPAPGAPLIVDEVTLELRAGELLAVVGPNGAGKSTLLSLLAGDRAPSTGEVWLDGEPLARFGARALARRRAVLRQQAAIPFGFLGREIVALGRMPWRGVADRADDWQLIAEAMRLADVEAFALRRATTLSGGEQARLALARVLAQDTAILLLDEPTASLDPRHQHDVMGVASALAAADRSVLAVLHDLNLAAAYADRIAILHEGRVLACAPPAEALTEARLRAAYQHPLRVVDHPLADRPLVLA